MIANGLVSSPLETVNARLVWKRTVWPALIVVGAPGGGAGEYVSGVPSNEPVIR